MATPITWRTIAGPTFNNSAGGQAIDAFRSAGAGFSDLTDSLFTTQDRIDKGYTNEAIRQTLQTGQIDPNLNPRADSTQVWEALLGKREADTNNAYTQAQTRNVGLEADQRAFEQTPEQRAIQARQTAQELAAGEIGMQADLAGINADEVAARLNQKRFEIENRNDEESQLINGQYRQLEQFLTQRRRQVYEQALQETGGNEAEANIIANQWDEYASRAEVEKFRVDNNILPEAYELSTWGGRDDLLDQSRQALAERAAEREQVRVEAGLDQEIAESQGYLGNTVIRDRKPVPYTKNMKDIERMGSYDEALGKLRAQGINVNSLDGKTSKDIEHQVIEAARQVMPNASLLAPAIEPFIQNGDFDAKGFRDNVVNKVGQLAIQNSINRARANANPPLPPIDFGESAESEGATAKDILGAASEAERSVLGSIALNLIPSSLRPDARKMLSEDTEARSRLAYELAKSAGSTPVDKANTFVTLLRAYLTRKDQEENRDSEADNN